MKKVLLLIPSLKDDGPVRGAIAIANGLCKYYEVSIVVLKKKFSHRVFIKPEIEIISLGKNPLWFTKYRIYKKILNEKCGARKPISISFCFSADLINLLVKNNATIISSVRASIPLTYYSTYGWPGKILAKFHIQILKRFKHVISMSESMSQQLKNFQLKGLFKVGNFIDEENLHKERVQLDSREKNYTRFVYLGSMIKRKRIDLLIEAVKRLKNDKILIKLDLIGEGPLKKEFKKKVMKLELINQIEFHGHLKNPFLELQRADYFVLPSIAEGVSRASLEALFFGIPCVLREVDANSELITHGVNGYLFKDDQDFFDLLRTISTTKLENPERKSLIPSNFKQEISIERLVQFLNSNF